jgi:phosphonopyruvate decarboxylase
VIDAVDLVRCLSEYSFGPYLAVPCTLLKPLLSAILVRDGEDFFAVPNEGDGVGIAAGAQLAGRKPVVICQNSGIGNMMNPLTSLIHTFRIPMLLIVSWRGEPGFPDEPQHDLIGQITCESLSLLGVENTPLPSNPDMLRGCLATAVQYMETNSLPFAFTLSRQTVTGVPEATDPGQMNRVAGELTHVCEEPGVMTRLGAIKTIMSYMATVTWFWRPLGLRRGSSSVTSIAPATSMF